MRINSFAISSLLAFTSVVSAVENSITNNDFYKFQRNNQNQLNSETEIAPPPCPYDMGNINYVLRLCNELNGKFYSEFYPFPRCTSEYVCFIGKNSDTKPIKLMECISIDNTTYCSVGVSNIECCRTESESYNFNQCVTEAKKRFNDFNYSNGPSFPRFYTKTFIRRPATEIFDSKLYTVDGIKRTITTTTTKINPVYPPTKTYEPFISEPTYDYNDNKEFKYADDGVYFVN